MASNSTMQNEIWVDVKGYEGLYQVSNCGNVRSLSHMVNGNSHGVVTLRLSPSKVLTKCKTGRNGNYHCVRLCKDGKPKLFLVHRLVAEAFIPNPDNLPQVNHINECGFDNNVNNLEWVTSLENNNHGTRNLRISQSQKGKFVPKGKDNPNYGSKRSLETRKKMSRSALLRYQNAK